MYRVNWGVEDTGAGDSPHKSRSLKSGEGSASSQAVEEKVGALMARSG